MCVLTYIKRDVERAPIVSLARLEHISDNISRTGLTQVSSESLYLEQFAEGQ